MMTLATKQGWGCVRAVIEVVCCLLATGNAKTRRVIAGSWCDEWCSFVPLLAGSQKQKLFTKTTMVGCTMLLAELTKTPIQHLLWHQHQSNPLSIQQTCCKQMMLHQPLCQFWAERMLGDDSKQIFHTIIIFNFITAVRWMDGWMTKNCFATVKRSVLLLSSIRAAAAVRNFFCLAWKSLKRISLLVGPHPDPFIRTGTRYRNYDRSHFFGSALQ